MGFDYRTSTELGKQTLGGHRQNLVHTCSQEKGTVSSQKTEPDLPLSVQESPTVACCRVWDTEYNSACTSTFEGGHHYLHYPYHSLASDQTTGRKQPHPSAENWIKDLLNMALPIRTRPSFPLSLSHQEASINLLSLSIRGQTMKTIITEN